MNFKAKAVLGCTALVVTLAIGIRLLVILLFPDMGLSGDEAVYYRGAEEALSGDPISCFPFRPPLYIFFCAAVLGWVDHSIQAVRIVQAVLEGLTTFGIFWIARRSAGSRAGLIAGLLYALYPDFIAYSHYLWSETLFLFLLVLSILLFQRFRDRPTAPRALLLGVVWGALVLIKPYHFYILPAFLLWFLFEKRSARVGIRGRSSKRGAMLGALVLIPVVLFSFGWSAHISLREGRPIFLSTTGAGNLRSGTNVFPPPRFDYPRARMASPETRKNLGREEGVVLFVLRNPGLFASRAVEKMSYLVAPNSYLIRHIYWGDKYGRPGEMVPALRWATVYFSVVATLLLIVGFVLGVAISRNPFLVPFSLLYTGIYLAMICFTPSVSRYRLPLMIFAVVHTAFLIADWRSLGGLRRRPVALGLVALVLAGLGVLWWMRLSELVPALG